MSDVQIEDLYDHIRPEISLVPEELILQAMTGTIRDFCDVTRAYQYEVEGESITALVADYDIELPNTQVQPIAIEYMTVDGRECFMKAASWLNTHVPNWRTRSADDFRYFTQLDPRTFSFPGVPTRNGTIGGVYYRVSIKPLHTATTIDQVLSEEWLDAWADGTKAELMGMSGKPWSNPARAQQLTASYRAARGNATIRVNNSYGNPDHRWVGPKFA